VSQSKRSHVQARTRWREQAARLVARFLPGARFDGDRWVVPCGYCGGHGVVNGYSNDVQDCPAECFQGMTDASVVVLHGGKFDVALVRAHCERLIAEAKRRAADRVVFEDWTRDRGMGPDESDVPRDCRACGASGEIVTWENRGDADPEVHRPCHRCAATGIVRGWPGRLARKFGWERCSGCDGRGLCRSSNHDCRACSGRGGRWDTESIDQWYPCGPCDGSGNGLVRCRACKGRGRTRKPGITPGLAAGPGIARTAQRLLETLEGRCPWSPEAKVQSGTCGSCRGSRFMFEGVRRAVIDSMTASALQRYPDLPVREALDLENRVAGLACNDCRGTGHNLAGVLPPVEPPAAEHRKVHDSAGSARFEDHPEAWTFGRDYEGTLLTSQREHGECACTRSVPRGQHRSNDDLGPGFAIGQGSTLDERITAKGWQPSPWWRPFGMSDSRSAPRWRRGELRHAQRMRVG
jgi:hypothetical protein